MTASTPTGTASDYPMVPMHPKMVSAIKASPAGKIPAGLAKYLAAKKGKVAPIIKKKKKVVDPLAAMEKKLGVVS